MKTKRYAPPGEVRWFREFIGACSDPHARGLPCGARLTCDDAYMPAVLAGTLQGLHAAHEVQSAVAQAKEMERRLLDHDIPVMLASCSTSCTATSLRTTCSSVPRATG